MGLGSRGVYEALKLLFVTDKNGHIIVDSIGASVVNPATTPAIYNVTMTSADTEYSQALTTGTKKFTIATRDRTAFRLAFVTGKVAASTAPFMDIVANEVYYEDNLSLTSKTLYFASASAGKIIEIIEWT